MFYFSTEEIFNNSDVFALVKRELMSDALSVFNTNARFKKNPIFSRSFGRSSSSTKKKKNSNNGPPSQLAGKQWGAERAKRADSEEEE